MKTYNTSVLPAFVQVVAIGLFVSLPAGKAFSQADFYKGKTIKIIRGGGPGGSGEFQTRALVKFLEKYIPGKPTLMVEFVEGAAGRKATNVIYSSSRPDGLTIGSIGAGLVVGPILGLPGSNYDLDKLIYLGSTDTGDPYVFYTKGDLGLDSIARLRATSGLRFGAHAVGHPVYVTARFVAYLLNLKDPKFVTGFTGPEIYIALQRGEIDAHATGAARFVIENPEWIEKKLVHFHATYTVPKGRTALLDAIYLGISKMRQAKYPKKALLIISDGGDNHSRYTEGEIKNLVKEADVLIYAIGIYDHYFPTEEERLGPQLLGEVTELTGGRAFTIDNPNDLADVATKIGIELRNQYVLGYRPKNPVRDGKWRKIKVKLNPPKGLPPLKVYAKTGYYAPSE